MTSKSIPNILLLSAFVCCLSNAQISKASVGDDELLTRRSPISQPYKYVELGSLSGQTVVDSPDPLVNYVWYSPKASNPLQIFVVNPVFGESTSGSNNVNGLATINNNNCDINITGNCVIRFDFGTELPAWIEIDSQDLTGDIEMGISEYNVPELINKTRTPVKYGNTYRLELNSELYEGVRYGFIYVRNFQKPFKITSVRAVSQVKPTNYTGSFDCDNPLINKIWYVGAWDVKANLREDCFGAILLERGDRFSWTGDAYPAQAASLVAFSNYDEVLKNLNWTESHPNNIESYELYWVESLIDYYMFTGDTVNFKRLIPMAEKRLAHAWSIFDNPSNLGFFGWGERTGRGFDHPDTFENQLGYKMLAIGAWKHFAKMLRTVGENTKADTYDKWASYKTMLFTKLSRNISSLGMHSSADAINADLVSDPQQIYHPDFTDRVHRLSYSPFNEYMVINAMAKAGHYDDAFGAVLDEWGEQIKYGATCFLEVYRPSWNNIIEKNGPIPASQAGWTSLAHPWGAGVTSWLSKEMLGIKPTTPGFKTFEVKPHFEGVATRVSGQVNTPNGPIKASFNLVTGLDTLIVPQNTEASLAIPKEGMTIQKVELNGNVVESPSEDANFLYISNLTEGSYGIRVYYSGDRKQFSQQENKYAVNNVAIDRTTQGEWFKKYGKEGYFIVGGGDYQQDLQKLPDYVESVTFDLGGEALSTHRTTTINSIDPMAKIPVSSEPNARKVFGCYFSSGLRMCPAEIKVKQDSPYTVAVYVADCDKGGRDLEVDLFDLETSNIIAPATRISDFAGGVYFVFTYDKSVRILCNNIRGDNSVINAIYFDNGPKTVDAINNLKLEKSDNKMYTLTGVPVEKDSITKGVYVSNGRNILVK